MDRIVDSTAADMVGSLCCKSVHRELQLLGDAVDQIREQVVAVDTAGADTDRVELIFALCECRKIVYDRVSLLGCKADSC